MDLVIGVGFIFGPRPRGGWPSSSRTPRFAGVDYSPSEGRGHLAQPRRPFGSASRRAASWSARSRGLLTHSKVVGFVGGHEDPADPQVSRRGYEAGGPAGVPDVPRGVGVRGAPSPRRSPIPTARPGAGVGAVRARGRDIIFHAAGKDGRRGVRGGAPAAGSRAIGVDSDQFRGPPRACVVTSMVKRVDVAVVDITKDINRRQVPRRAARARARRARRVGFVADERKPPAVCRSTWSRRSTSSAIRRSSRARIQVPWQ